MLRPCHCVIGALSHGGACSLASPHSHLITFIASLSSPHLCVPFRIIGGGGQAVEDEEVGVVQVGKQRDLVLECNHRYRIVQLLHDDK